MWKSVFVPFRGEVHFEKVRKMKELPSKKVSCRALS